MAYQKTLITHIKDSDLTGDGDKLVTANTGDGLATSVPLLYDADGNVISTATRTGNTTNYATATAGSKTTNNYPKWDANGNLTDGDTGGSGSGGESFSFWSITAPPSSGWTAINSASVTTPGNSRVITSSGAGSASLVGEVRSLSDPQTSIVGLVAVDGFGTGSGIGLWLRESSTGKIAAYYFRQGGSFQRENWNSPTSFNSLIGAAVSTNAFHGAGFGLKLEFGPTNRVISLVIGNMAFVLDTIAKNTFATTAFDEFGWMVRDDSPVLGELFHLA